MVLYVAFKQVYRPHVCEVLVVGTFYHRVSSRVAERVHNHVMGYAHDPGAELSRCCIHSLLKAVNDLQKCLLKYIICLVLIVHDEKDV